MHKVNDRFLHEVNGMVYIIKGAWDGRYPYKSVALLMREDGKGHNYCGIATPVKDVWCITEEEFYEMTVGHTFIKLIVPSPKGQKMGLFDLSIEKVLEANKKARDVVSSPVLSEKNEKLQNILYKWSGGNKRVLIELISEIVGVDLKKRNGEEDKTWSPRKFEDFTLFISNDNGYVVKVGEQFIKSNLSCCAYIYKQQYHLASEDEIREVFKDVD